MSEIQGDSAPLLDHVKALAAAGDPEEIERLERVAKPPYLTEHIWRWFQDLSQSRQSGGMGVARLSRLEIQAWERDEGVGLRPWERRAIIQLDALFVTFANKPREAKQ